MSSEAVAAAAHFWRRNQRLPEVNGKGTIKRRRRFVLAAFLVLAMLEITAAVVGGSQADASWRSSFIDEPHRDRCCPHSKAKLALLAAKTTDQSRLGQPRPGAPRLRASHNEVGRGGPNCVRIPRRLRVGVPTRDWTSAGGFVPGESNLSWLSHLVSAQCQ